MTSRIYLLSVGALALLLAGSAQAATIDLSQDIDARGVQPAWTLKVRGTQFTLVRPAKPDVVASAPGATITPAKAVWVTRTSAGAPMTVSLVYAQCVLGTVRYPITAQVMVGSETLAGCAAKSADLPNRP